MFPGTGIENDIQNIFYSLFFLGKVPPTADVVGGFCFLLFEISGWLSVFRHLAADTSIE